MSTVCARGASERGELIVPEDRAWLEATSIEAVVEHWPERVDLLLEAIDLDRPGLAKVKAAVETGDKARACAALLRYYEKDGRRAWILDLLPEPGDRDVEVADDLLEGKVHLYRRVDKVPAKHGAWDWNHTGPNDNREFAYSLNRHPFFIHLLQAYRRTGDEKYARTFDRIVRDWILHTVYPGQEHAYVWTWRVLEAALRMRSWLPAFHGFLQSDGFSPAGRLLMLSSFVQHGRYIRMHHWNHHNHALMEFDGLNRLGLALPELKQADAWHRYAVKQMLEEMDHQVYPDGAHDELSSGYHWVSLHSFEQLAEVCRAAGEAVPDDYRDRLEDMYDYWIGLVRPDGALPQNNRSDRKVVTRRILDAAEKYNRPDWRYIASNGAEGERPDSPPSRFAPYAGHLVSRSGWDADAMWSFFDAGPAGAGWVHADTLHLSLTAYGKDFLVDSGRFWYMRDQWTRFAHSSRSHNVILIDDRGQKTTPKKTDKPLADEHWAITTPFDFARSAQDQFKDLDGRASHTRTVVFLRGTGWVVVDRIETDRHRALTAMWRFRPQRKVRVNDDGAIITADTEGANLSITPAGAIDWQAALIRGQEKPYLQGWFSEQTPDWTPNPCVELRAKVEGDAAFAWVILPREAGPAPEPKHLRCTVEGDAAKVSFVDPAGRPIALTIPLTRGKPTLDATP